MSAESRFAMVKKHHAESLQKAIHEKKIDSKIMGICQHLAGTKNYFTTSTCSGRIALMELNENETKRENVFYRKWHRTVKPSEVWKAIEEYNGNENVWMRQDAFVYVIGTNTFENAKKIFQACQDCGIKRYGIHHFEEGKIIIEVFGTQNMSVPVIEKGKILVNEKNIKKLTGFANKKWKRNEQKRKQFEKILRQRLN